MKHLLVACILALNGLGIAHSQSQLQQSHNEANVPEAAAFERILQRDLLDHVKSRRAQTASRVQYSLLRDAPTQSGTAYPKFYAWVKFYAGKELIAQGAVRAAAVQKTRFDVTHFLDAATIRSNPEALSNIFPAALVPAIIQQAKAA